MKNIFIRPSRRIATKMITAVTVTLCLATVIFVYFASRTGTRLLNQQVQAKAHGISRFGIALLEHSMLEGNQGHVEDLFRAGVNAGEATSLFIVRTDGSIAFSSDTSMKNGQLPLKNFTESPFYAKARFFSQEENDTLYEYIVNPIETKPECSRCHVDEEKLRGFFGVKISMTDLVARADEHRSTNILLTAVSFLIVALVVFTTLLLFVNRPLLRLQQSIISTTDQLHLIEEGKLRELDPIRQPSTTDEIGIVSIAFNRLILKLNEAHENIRKLHHNELQQADRLKAAGEMAASIAHEIRNPMAGVSGALQVLYAEMDDDNPRKVVLKEMLAQMQRMNDSLNDLLSYAKPASPVFQETDINDVIERTLTLATSEADARVTSIERQYDQSIPPIVADQRLLQQLFWNILLNAIQSMDNKGTIAVSTSLTNGSTQDPLHGSVLITVRDSGKGIPFDELDKIFIPFHTTKHTGTGLGLAVSKQIVEQHGGSIEVSSEVGCGTTVTVVLPIHSDRSNLTYAA